MERISTVYEQLKELLVPMDVTLALAGLTSFVVAMLVVPAIIRVAKKKNLLDQPNHRKEHKIPVPTLGGIGIFSGFVAAIAIWFGGAEGSQIQYLLTSLLILFITGILDDLREIKASKKLLIQIVAAAIVVASGIRIESMAGLFGIYELPLWAQYGLTILVIAAVTNAMNLMDGIDGLAGGISCINALLFFALFVTAGDRPYGIVAIALAGALLGFLFFNFNPAKIFMGDTGSLVIGFILIVLGIKYLQKEALTDVNSLTIVYGILVLPVFDTLRVFVIRIFQGRSPFSPDKNHIHHMLVKTGFDHKKSALLMYGANVVLIATAFVLTRLNIHLIANLVILTLLNIFLMELLTIKKLLQARIRMRRLASRRLKRQSENYLLTKLDQLQ